MTFPQQPTQLALRLEEMPNGSQELKSDAASSGMLLLRNPNRQQNADRANPLSG